MWSNVVMGDSSAGGGAAAARWATRATLQPPALRAPNRIRSPPAAPKAVSGTEGFLEVTKASTRPAHLLLASR
jgi:hypothetical protein